MRGGAIRSDSHLGQLLDELANVFCKSAGDDAVFELGGAVEGGEALAFEGEDFEGFGLEDVGECAEAVGEAGGRVAEQVFAIWGREQGLSYCENYGAEAACVAFGGRGEDGGGEW